MVEIKIIVRSFYRKYVARFVRFKVVNWVKNIKIKRYRYVIIKRSVKSTEAMTANIRFYGFVSLALTIGPPYKTFCAWSPDLSVKGECPSLLSGNSTVETRFRPVQRYFTNNYIPTYLRLLTKYSKPDHLIIDEN